MWNYPVSHIKNLAPSCTTFDHDVEYVLQYIIKFMFLDHRYVSARYKRQLTKVAGAMLRGDYVTLQSMCRRHNRVSGFCVEDQDAKDTLRCTRIASLIKKKPNQRIRGIG